jgi:hypothetical protein
MTSYFIPLHFFSGGHDKIETAGGTAANHLCSGDLCQFTANPAALIVPNRKGKHLVSQVEKLGQSYVKDALGHDNTSSSMHLITSKGVTVENAVMSPETVNSVLSYEFCAVASRSNVLAAYSSTTKDCSFYYLNVIPQNSITGSGPPVVYKFDFRKSVQCSSFSLSDVAVRMCPQNTAEQGREKEKENEKGKGSNSSSDNPFQIGGGSLVVSDSRRNAATFHPVDRPTFRDNETEIGRDFILGKVVLLLVGDTKGKVHYCLVDKSCVLQSGVFQAHSSPIVAVITSGDEYLYLMHFEYYSRHLYIKIYQINPS